MFDEFIVWEFVLTYVTTQFLTLKGKFFNECLLKEWNWTDGSHSNLTGLATFSVFVLIWFLVTALAKRRMAMCALDTWQFYNVVTYFTNALFNNIHFNFLILIHNTSLRNNNFTIWLNISFIFTLLKHFKQLFIKWIVYLCCSHFGMLFVRAAC